jgi:hypothetical protein
VKIIKAGPIPAPPFAGEDFAGAAQPPDESPASPEQHAASGMGHNVLMQIRASSEEERLALFRERSE